MNSSNRIMLFKSSAVAEVLSISLLVAKTKSAVRRSKVTVNSSSVLASQTYDVHTRILGYENCYWLYTPVL